MKNLLAYLNKLTTQEQDVFAEGVGTSVGYLRKACCVNQRLSADMCIRIERESNGDIRCEELRPDVDWAYLRGTKKAA